ncbi:hypothetical protein [Pararhodobacter zhoushanensis]|uniref:Sulfotransferase domain-containing protein n=1 Tax=Pararhodobacter zhoushanensis TaxID=2479545 RepID=A0ABT3H011_9RHOB|nr:hypothetical protein [Pararhodobacter zhoushanensis]MCW1933132.1 hypothetical protein [Pararhodobacter zhoushanensis]
MSRLILHVGTHKTGTSSVQRVLYDNRAQLAGLGVVYPDPYYGVEHHAMVGRLTELAPAYLPPNGRLSLWEAMADQYAGTDASVIISSELLSVAANAEEDLVAQIAQVARRFDDVVVVCFYRNQVSFVQASYLEVIKKRAGHPIIDTVAVALRNADFRGAFYHNRATHAALKRSFGTQAMRPLSYDAVSVTPTGVLDAILALTGRPVRAAQLDRLEGLNSNRSPDPLATYVARQVSDVPNIPQSVIDLAQKALDQHFGAGRATTLLTRAEIVALTKKFTASNELMNADLRHDGHEPLALPFPDWSDRIHREDLRAGYWLELARVMALALA